jgi:hypothetical protein
MINDDGPTGAESGGSAPISGDDDNLFAPMAPTVCCGVAPMLRRVERSVAFACRFCTRMGEPGHGELSAVEQWNRDLEIGMREIG